MSFSFVLSKCFLPHSVAQKCGVRDSFQGSALEIFQMKVAMLEDFPIQDNPFLSL